MKKTIMQIPGKAGLVLLRVLTFLLTVILLLPLLLLPNATAIPLVIQIILFIFGLASFSLLFWLRPAWKAMSYAPTAALFVLTLTVILSQAFAMTPTITGADGKPLPGSIATLEQVTLNGTRQWVSIRGKDAAKPVLLFLAGGPRRQPAIHRTLCPARFGRPFRGGQLGTTRSGEIIQRG